MPAKPPSSSRRGPSGTVGRKGRVRFRAKGKGGKKGGNSARDKARKARSGPGENMGVSLRHVVGTPARIQRAGEVARLVRILVAQAQAVARMAAIGDDPDDGDGPAAGGSPRGVAGADMSFLDDTSLASPPMMVQCMRFLSVSGLRMSRVRPMPSLHLSPTSA